MTRKDYVAIAEALNQSRPIGLGDVGINTDDAEVVVWKRTRWSIANVLAADNARFDRDRFYRACEGME